MVIYHSFSTTRGNAITMVAVVAEYSDTASIHIKSRLCRSCVSVGLWDSKPAKKKQEGIKLRCDAVIEYWIVTR
jgi:hypothetical protein